MNYDPPDWVTSLIITFGFVLGAWVGDCRGKKVEKQMAIEAGVAHYRIDKITGEVTFVYGKD